MLDDIFLYIYTAEAAMKIGGLGLISPNTAYFKDKWNILDFCIVLSAWVSKLSENGINLSALRTLRVLRPLRSISSI